MLLKSQPDIGMLAVITVVFLAQLYINGLPLVLVGMAMGLISGGAFMAYTFFPHVRVRFDGYWKGEGDHYQINTALEAFGNGGFTGRGAGEGRVKDILPDAHADFVYAVAGEEFGMVICVVILAVFAFVVMRGLLRLLREQDLFVVLSCTGLVDGFRPAGVRQYGLHAGSDPDQGNDAAVHFLWRIFGHRGCSWDGHAARSDPAAWPE